LGNFSSLDPYCSVKFGNAFILVLKTMLHFFNPGDFYYYIVNIASVEMEFVSDSISNVLKIKPEVLHLVLCGKSTLEIAELLAVSVHTINSHRKNILSKSQCSSLA